MIGQERRLDNRDFCGSACQVLPIEPQRTAAIPRLGSHGNFVSLKCRSRNGQFSDRYKETAPPISGLVLFYHRVANAYLGLVLLRSMIAEEEEPAAAAVGFVVRKRGHGNEQGATNLDHAPPVQADIAGQGRSS
jgi:hypothetical protein